MNIRKKIADWLDRGHRQAYEELGIPTDGNGTPLMRTRPYLVVRQWYDTGNMTSDIFFGCSNAEILRLADEENVKAGKKVCAIVNIIQLDE